MEISYQEYLKSIGEIPDRHEFNQRFIYDNLYLSEDDGYVKIDHYYYVQLVPTWTLYHLADDIRAAQGHTRVIEDDEFKNDYIYIDYYIEFHLNGDVRLSFIISEDRYSVDNPIVDDNGKEYYFELSKEEQNLIYEHLKEDIENRFYTEIVRTDSGFEIEGL